MSQTYYKREQRLWEIFCWILERVFRRFYIFFLNTDIFFLSYAYLKKRIVMYPILKIFKIKYLQETDFRKVGDSSSSYPSRLQNKNGTKIILFALTPPIKPSPILKNQTQQDRLNASWKESPSTNLGTSPIFSELPTPRIGGITTTLAQCQGWPELLNFPPSADSTKWSFDNNCFWEDGVFQLLVPLRAGGNLVGERYFDIVNYLT